MSVLKDLTGQRFGRFTVICRGNNDNQGKPKWKCLCDCGNVREVLSSNLLKGCSNSCGCLQKELLSKRMTKIGESRTRLYKIWNNMALRCNKKENKDYKNYGGRGIEVCEEWKNFLKFKEWSITNGYKDNLTIDRIDVNGNYEPLNCKWATRSEQSNNRRECIYLTKENETKTITQWERELGFKTGSMLARYHKGESIETLFNPVKKGV